MLHKLNKRAVVIIVAVVAIVAVVGSSLAWFATRSSLFQQLTLNSFDVGAEVYFVDGNSKVSAEDYTDENGLYVLSLNEADVNYIGNLRAGVTLDGGSACVRVTMNHQWTSADGEVLQRSVAVPYEFGELWFDNRNTDYSVYYAGEDMSGKATFEAADFITGFSEADFDTADLADGTQVKVLIQADAVQVNRYPQLWNIEKLPWK
ncbi:MAG: hypothetical protein IJ447_02480 [Clostridia bacterium]|nr:hypothetical protein [Clostridia bacterium]